MSRGDYKKWKLWGVTAVAMGALIPAAAQEPQPPKEAPPKEATQQTGKSGQAAQTSAQAAGQTPAQTTPQPSTDSKKTSTGDLPDYKIGEQDVLNITIWKEPQLSGSVVVRPDGKISLPLVDEVSAAGLTPLELQNVLVEKYRPYLTVPQVSVSAKEINSRKVYVIGQVAREGSFRINSNSTVLEILAEAGGLKDYANRKKIYVMRSVQGKQVRYPFNYEAVIRGEHYEENIVLQPGDKVVVP